MTNNHFRITVIGAAIFCFGLLTDCSQTNKTLTPTQVTVSHTSTVVTAIVSNQSPYPAPMATLIPTAYPAPATIEVLEATRNAAVHLTLTAQPTPTPSPTPCPPSTIPESYVGCQHPPLPAGLASETVYGFSVVTYGNLRMLWLDKSLGYHIGGEPYWEVRAILVLPDISESETFVEDTCRVNGGEPDPEIFVIAEAKPNASLNLDNIKQAWRANRKTSAFEQIPADGIVCFISPMEYWR